MPSCLDGIKATDSGATWGNNSLRWGDKPSAHENVQEAKVTGQHIMKQFVAHEPSKPKCPRAASVV